MEDFDATLYFLDEREIGYLREAVREDFARDLRPSVVAGLFDTFENETDPTVREEICGILDTLLLTLLANRQFRIAAYLLREAAVTAGRAGDLLPPHQERLHGLRVRLSEPTVVAQLLEAVEESPLDPPQADVRELFSQLMSSTLETIFSFITRTPRPELRVLLEEVATRLCASDTAELVRLIGSDDNAVAQEAIRRAGAVGSTAAVTPLARALGAASEDVRKAAVAALSAIGSAGAMQAIERAVEDDDRDIRISAVRSITERNHRAALSRVERVLRERVLRDGTTTEKSAFMDAYATLAGDAGVPLLDGILNPKGLLSRKGDPQTRACAAMALGKIGSSRALDALRKAGSESDVVVRTAAARALRSSE